MSTTDTAVRTRRAIREPSAAIPWRVLQDERLSFRAAGILGELLSRPEGWRTSATRLAAKRKEGREAVETALRELVDVGYLIRQRARDANGLIAWVWVYGDDPTYVAEVAADELAAIRTSRRDDPA